VRKGFTLHASHYTAWIGAPETSDLLSEIARSGEFFALLKIVMSVMATLMFIMAALWNRVGHYIFALWFLLLSSSSIYLFFLA